MFVAVLVVVPGLLWLAAVVVPFLPLATATKLWLVPTLVVAAEAVFWVAALLLGREAVMRYRRFADPRTWSRRDKN